MRNFSPQHISAVAFLSEDLPPTKNSSFSQRLSGEGAVEQVFPHDTGALPCLFLLYEGC